MTSITKAADLCKDAEIMYSTSIKWEEFLSPAPLSISLLGKLLLISTQKDFTLQKKPPTGGFRKLRYPDSFRASLVQVSNEGWKAFNQAHSSMEQIRMNTAQIPKHLKNAVKIIMAEGEADAAEMLEIPLGAILDIANQCLESSQSTHEKFVDVMDLIGEVLEACTNAKGQYEKDLKETEDALKVAKQYKEEYERQKDDAVKKYDEMKKQTERAYSEYEKQLNAPPSLLSIAKAVVSVVSPFTALLSSKPTGSFQIPTQQDSESQITNPANESYSHAEPLNNLVKALTKISDSVNVDEDIGEIKAYVLHEKSSIEEQQDCKAKKKALQICSSVLEIVSEVINAREKMSTDEWMTKNVKDKVKKLEDKSKNFLTEATSKSGIKLGKTPKMAQNGVQQSFDEENYKLHSACEQLKRQQEMQEKSYDEMNESTQKLTKVMAEMTKLDLTRIDFDEIKTVLVEGMKALAEVREQWGKMVRFFDSITNIIKCQLNSSLHLFKKSIEKGMAKKSQGKLLSACMIDQIYTYTADAAKVGHVVNQVSNMYVKVSDSYIMDRVASLGKLVALDPATEADKIEENMKQIDSDCNKMQKDIKDMVKKSQDNFRVLVNERIMEMEEQLQLMAAAAPETNERNKAIARAAMDESEIDEFA